MTEPTKKYYGQGTACTVDAFKNRPCALPFTDECFVPPTGEEVRALRKLLAYSQTDLARLTGVHFNEKGSNTVRKWERNADHSEHRQINLSAWRLMLLKAGVIRLDDDRHLLGK